MLRLSNKNNLHTRNGKEPYFLYPVLNYCYQHKGEPGIKTVLIYPMNALTMDQAGRLAKLIFNSQLKDHVTAGIYVGQREQNPSMLMTQERALLYVAATRAKKEVIVTSFGKPSRFLE